IARFVRWRIKDWASCFLLCRFPLGNKKANNKNKKMLKHPHKNCNKERQLSSSTTPARNISTTPARNIRITTEDGTDDDDSSRWPHFVDEEYIVFCFKEDGAFDVKHGKSPTSNRLAQQTISRRSPVSVVNRKVEEEESMCLDVDAVSPSAGMRRKYQIETENFAAVSVESSDSNQSDGSTGSFAFPVVQKNPTTLVFDLMKQCRLRWEFMGSPAKMPKSNDLHFRKHKALSMTFPCCRF
ncbi:hypothetical protein CFOL_v3_25255, partial [Cephalotus follicularis]